MPSNFGWSSWTLLRFICPFPCDWSKARFLSRNLCMSHHGVGASGQQFESPANGSLLMNRVSISQKPEHSSRSKERAAKRERLFQGHERTQKQAFPPSRLQVWRIMSQNILPLISTSLLIIFKKMNTQVRWQTSIRNNLVGTIMPNPAELRNDSTNFWSEKLRNSFSVNLARFPALTNMWPCMPDSLNSFNGKLKDRSAKAVTAKSPPSTSCPGEVVDSSLFDLSMTNLRMSVGPNPLDLKPNNIVGPDMEQTGEALPPMKNLSGKGVDMFMNPLPHGKMTPADIPKLSAAL